MSLEPTGPISVAMQFFQAMYEYNSSIDSQVHTEQLVTSNDDSSRSENQGERDKQNNRQHRYQQHPKLQQ